MPRRTPDRKGWMVEALGRLLGRGAAVDIVLAAQQRAFVGKTSDREAAGVGAPGIGVAPA